MAQHNDQIIIRVTKHWLSLRKSPKMLKCQICNKKLEDGDHIRMMGSHSRPRALHEYHKRY